MPALTRLALLAVVFVDLLGQGLVFPIFTSLMMDPTVGFLPAATSAAERELSYGIVIGVFFIFWFFGVAYVAKASDLIGRKNAILICLAGAFVGYLLTILALALNSYWLLLLGRAITGFTAGNQPIAQAAMVDLSSNDTERARNMGLIVAGVSAGVVCGPIIGGLLTDKTLLGGLASLALPFYVALAMVGTTFLLIVVSFHDVRPASGRFRINPLEIFTLLFRVFQNPVVLRLSVVFFLFMFVNVSFYIFFDNYLTARFGIGLLGTNLAMMELGSVIALSSCFLVVPAQRRFRKDSLIAAGMVVMALSLALFVFSDAAYLCYLAIGTFYLVFGISYPVFLGIFSASVGDDEQGWIMGITTAQFTLAGGIMSLIGGGLMGIDIRLPFLLALGAPVLALIAMALLWRGAAVSRLMQK